MDKKLLCAAFALCAFAGVEAKENTPQKRNVLFIMIDDLRPELTCYGDEGIISPNIDRLSAQGTQFMRGYCNVPVSGASRASLMTGLRPTKDRFIDFESEIAVDAPHVTILPQHFRQSGYNTVSNGKIVHHVHDIEGSWDIEWLPKGQSKTFRDYYDEESRAKEETRDEAPAYEMLDVPDNAYLDGKTTDKALEDMRRLAKAGEPFFLAVGFVKPHLPFNAPKKYWDLYPEESITLPENFTMDRTGIPSQAFHDWGELRFYKDIDRKGDVCESMAKTLIRGYRACVSYADAQVGRLLDELESLGLADDTIVVLIGDHGWSLGEHSLWCKHSNFGVANHTPMIIKDPRERAGKVNNVVEFIDIFPTLCDMAGIDTPSHTEGASLYPLIKNPKAKSNNYAVMKWKTGLTLVDGRYTYTEWYNKKSWEAEACLLFDDINDPDQNHNLAELPKYKSIVKRMSKQLEQRRGKDF